MNKYEIPVSVILTDDDIDNIMVSALEGGINYWVIGKVAPKNDNFNGADYASHALSKGATLLVTDENETHELTLDRFLKGYARWADWRLAEIGKLWGVQHLDAADADCIVQFAIFDEVVYSG
jgi:hypothetical protein